MKKQLLTLFTVTAILASCGGDQKVKDTQDTETETETTLEESVEANPNSVELTGNDQMKFNVSEIRVKAGEPVKLTLRNAGTIVKEAMGHNFVLLKNGTNVEEFGKASMNSKETDYIPESMKTSIIAHTKLLGPNESDTITFTLEKGEYDFICSFPGHYTTMRGKLIVE
ncbi:azurin [Pedobacter sp. P351]|uniref:azurin n=1 Tax=Pedobacter superstes TaxID=3133441 RepID=UPI0030A91FCE